ncbi:MAG: hypothetical protein V1727_04835 [Candidatus Omnitrophota bacterium]
MKRVDNRQYKLTQIKPAGFFKGLRLKAKIGRRQDAKLDRRGMK